jgi:hypothetical protein
VLQSRGKAAAGELYSSVDCRRHQQGNDGLSTYKPADRQHKNIKEKKKRIIIYLWRSIVKATNNSSRRKKGKNHKNNFFYFSFPLPEALRPNNGNQHSR